MRPSKPPGPAEAGRGFAVVASEVKSLPARPRSHRRDLVANFGHAGRDAGVVAAIKEIGGTIGQISSIAAAIASAVEEQSSATQGNRAQRSERRQGSHEVAANITK